MIKRDLHRRLIYECRCDERLKDKAEGSTRLTYSGFRGEMEHPKDRDTLKIETSLSSKFLVFICNRIKKDEDLYLLKNMLFIINR